MRPEVQVLPGPLSRLWTHCRTTIGGKVAIVNLVRKPLLLAAAVGGALLAVVRRRHSQASEALWREATSDSSR